MNQQGNYLAKHKLENNINDVLTGELNGIKQGIKQSKSNN